MGKNSNHFTTDLWKDLFGIFVLSNEETLSNHSFHCDFDLRTYLNSCLKAPRTEDNLNKVSTGYLKRNSCILHWIVTHVLRPRKGGHSRIDTTEVHLMYILQNNFNIN